MCILSMEEGPYHIVKENVRWDGCCTFGKYYLPKRLTLEEHCEAKKTGPILQMRKLRPGEVK